MSLDPGLQNVMAGNSISRIGIPVEEIVVTTCFLKKNIFVFTKYPIVLGFLEGV